jgi:Bifunctional DNA primase/polymerase, N-terminal
VTKNETPGQTGGSAPTSSVVLTYAAMGLYVFPCAVKGRDKTPLVKWGDASTTDPGIIRGWWDRWPDACIGVDCGKSGLIVVDLDVKDGIDGPGNWKNLVDGHDVPATFYVRTPSKGWHLWFRDPGGKYRLSAGKVAPAVDVRAGGGFVVAPGSPGYHWHAEAPLSLDDIPAMPDGIIPASNGGGTTGHWKKLDRGALEPRDLAALEALEGLGGQGAYLSDGHVTVTRPGKIAGASASIGFIGPGIVKVFTPNWPPLEEGNVYDADSQGRPRSRQSRRASANATKSSDAGSATSTTSTSWTSCCAPSPRSGCPATRCGCSSSPDRVQRKPKPSRPARAPARSSSAPSAATPRSCPAAQRRIGPRTPPAGCSAKSATRACSP